MENEIKIALLKNIDAYVKGELSEVGIESLWNDIAKDPSILDHLEIEVGVRELILNKSGATEKSKKAVIRRLPSWAWYASAAAVVLFVALIQLFKVPAQTELHQFIVQTIPSDQYEFADALRSNQVNISKADSLLNLGFEAAFSGNKSKAMEFYNQVIAEFDREPYASKAFLNRGIIQYNSGEYTMAIASFTEAATRGEENRMIAEKANWFLANAYVHTGELEKALNAAGTTYSKNGVFREQSFRLYQKLNYDLGKVDYEDFEQQTGN
ncbi:MAG: tetratricopeptide repeat protein [Balneolaceae bacterium]